MHRGAMHRGAAPQRIWWFRLIRHALKCGTMVTGRSAAQKCGHAQKCGMCYRSGATSHAEVLVSSGQHHLRTSTRRKQQHGIRLAEPRRKRGAAVDAR